MSNKYFKFKYNMLDYSTFPEVKKVGTDFLNKNIDKNRALDALKEIYWTKIYGNLEDSKIAFSILEKTLFNPNKLLTAEDLLKSIESECKIANKEHLYVKIINSCPNGDSVCTFYLNSLE